MSELQEESTEAAAAAAEVAAAAAEAAAEEGIRDHLGSHEFLSKWFLLCNQGVITCHFAGLRLQVEFIWVWGFGLRVLWFRV